MGNYWWYFGGLTSSELPHMRVVQWYSGYSTTISSGCTVELSVTHRSCAPVSAVMQPRGYYSGAY